MKTCIWQSIALAVVVCACVPAWAHRFIPNDGSHSSADNALAINDVDVSQVAYQELSQDSPQLWFRLQAEAGQALHVEVGVPKIDRYAAYRPSYAIVGPGLPDASLPFAIPEGDGAWGYSTAEVASPEVFNEEFTGTESWIFPATDVVLPLAGTYYVVAYGPPGVWGKMWLAVGTAEKFGFSDIVTLPGVVWKVRTFHEVFPIGGLGMLIFAIALALVLFLFIGVPLLAI